MGKNFPPSADIRHLQTLESHFYLIQQILQTRCFSPSEEFWGRVVKLNFSLLYKLTFRSVKSNVITPGSPPQGVPCGGPIVQKMPLGNPVSIVCH